MILAGLLTGCSTTTAPQGRSGVDASYTLRTLAMDLPADVSVNAVAAAASSALRSRGYTVAGSTVTADGATVVGRDPGGSSIDRVVVRSWVTNAGTRAEITIEPLGDEPRARAIADRMLVSLGR